MAKFLTTTGMSAALEELIKSAKERIFLISPYLKLNDRIRSFLVDCDRLKLEFRIVYGKNELLPDEMERLRELKSLQLGFCKNLHAKCYLSEDRAIIGSMNLYDFSQQNNEEMGILVMRQDDPELFEAIYSDARRIVRVADSVAVTTLERVKPKAEPQVRVPKRADKPSAEAGFCIRCASEIPFNPERPYCAEHYKAWAKWSNEDYEDSHCHGCSEETVATMKKPLCRDCYRARA